jgi:hypothetical protein
VQQDRPNYILWGVLGVLGLGLIALVVFNIMQPKDLSKKAWNPAMTRGDVEAGNSFVEYTDVTCSHCAEFHNAAEKGDFEKGYIKSGKVHQELRVVPLLQEKRQNAVRSAESVYCAADQNKFWPYYNAVVDHFTTEYFDKNIATTPTSPDMPKLEDSFYIDMAKKTGLDSEKFGTCLKENQQLDTVKQAVAKASQTLPYGSGVPYFKINSFESSGFAGEYKDVQRMMRAGGVQ